MNKGIGQYDLEYSQCECFWGTDPGKYVRIITEFIDHGSVLDLGAGEGKNAIFVAELGFDVTAVEISQFAISNFKKRMQSLAQMVCDRIKIAQENVLKFTPDKEYDVVIAYGLLHCLHSIGDVNAILNKIKHWVKRNGLVVIVCFNNEFPVPDVQNYLEPTLLPKGYLKEAFLDFVILKYEEDKIVESHPTSNKEHIHGVSRIIARKIE